MTNTIAIYNEFEASLSEIKQACDFLPDVSTKEGYEKSKRLGLDGRKVEKAIDDKRLEMKKEAMKTADEIHTVGKALCEKVASYYKPHQDAYKAHDAELKRIKEEKEAAISAEIAKFGEEALAAHSLSADEISELIESMKARDIDYGNRTVEAGEARQKAIKQLEDLRASIIIREEQEKQLEEQRAELERQQEEQRKAQAIIDEQNRIEAEKLAEERRIQQEEQRKAQEAQRIKDAEEAAKEAERARIAEEERVAKVEAEKKAANKAHRKAINNAALNDLKAADFSEEDGKRIIELIAQGKISNISINY